VIVPEPIIVHDGVIQCKLKDFNTGIPTCFLLSPRKALSNDFGYLVQLYLTGKRLDEEVYEFHIFIDKQMNVVDWHFSRNT